MIVAAAGPIEATRRAVAGRARRHRARRLHTGRADERGSRPRRAETSSGSCTPTRGLRGEALGLIAGALADERVVSGAFAHRFTERTWSLGAINAINRIRYRLTRNYYGDQGIFVRAAVFRELGGYPDLALMEDLILSQRLKRRGRPALIATPLHTSGRRFLARGPWRTFGFIVWLLFLHTLGLDTQRYATRWRGPADRPPGSSLALVGSARLGLVTRGRAGRILVTGATGFIGGAVARRLLAERPARDRPGPRAPRRNRGGARRPRRSARAPGTDLEVVEGDLRRPAAGLGAAAVVAPARDGRDGHPLRGRDDLLPRVTRPLPRRPRRGSGQPARGAGGWPARDLGPALDRLRLWPALGNGPRERRRRRPGLPQPLRARQAARPRSRCAPPEGAAASTSAIFRPSAVVGPAPGHAGRRARQSLLPVHPHGRRAGRCRAGRHPAPAHRRRAPRALQRRPGGLRRAQPARARAVPRRRGGTFHLVVGRCAAPGGRCST